MYRNIFALFLFMFSVIPVAAQVEPYDLTVEYMTAPVGLDEPAPRLSWKSRTTEPGLAANLRGVVQTAYHVLVASSPEILASDKGDLWDSGTVESDQSLNIEYAGKPLETSQRCYWKVRVTYNKNLSRYSGVSQWVMGVTKPEDWKAKWIGSDSKMTYEDPLQGAKWIWTGDATDLSVAPQGKRFFRKEFTVPDALDVTTGTLKITADDKYEVFLNGVKVTQTWGHFNDWKWLRRIDMDTIVLPKKGKNVIAVAVTNDQQGPTGLLLQMTFGSFDGGKFTYNIVSSDGSWTSSAEATDGWNAKTDFQNDKWKSVAEVGPVDCEPWGKIQRKALSSTPAFGKTFSVDKKIKMATLHITGLGFYEASLNGQKIGNKVLDPMQTRYDKRVLYSTYDLTDSLKAGSNRLNVLLGNGWYNVRSVAVWNFDNAPWRDLPKMLAQLEIVYEDGSKQTVVSDESWEQIENPVYSDCIRQGEASRSDFGEVCGKAEIVDAPKGRLVAEAVPASVVAEEWKPVKIWEPTPGVYVVDAGRNIAGWIQLRLDGQKKSDVVQIRYAERLAPDGNIDMKPINEHFRHRWVDAVSLDEKTPIDMFQTDIYVCDGTGPYVYEPRFMYHGFQYVEIKGLAQKPAPEQITCRMVHNDFKTVGKFECSNELFNKIQAATVLSYKGNFVNGVPTDCPHREKNGWTGDAQLASTLAQYNFDNTAAYEKWIYDLLDEQREDGNLPGIVPTSGWGYAWGNGPAWDSALCIIPWELYQYKGDRRILERAYPAMKKYVDYLTSREKEDGLVYHGLSDWCPANTRTDAVVTSSVYYFIDAEIVAFTAGLLGKQDDFEKYTALAEKIKTAYKKVLYKEDSTIANGSQVSQSFALYYGLIDREEEQSVVAKLLEAVEKADNHLDVGILGAKTLFHTLSRHADRTDLAMKILNQKTAPGYGDWFERGATTLWEDWGDGASRNHIMFGDVSAWFFQTLGGIKPCPFLSNYVLNAISKDEDYETLENLDKASWAFKGVEISPQYPKGIDWVKAEHDSPYGPIKVDWRRDGTKIKLNFAVPVNSKAMFGTEWYGSGEYSFEFDAP